MSNIIGGGGGDSEWTVDGNGNLVPKDGEPVSIEAAQFNGEPYTSVTYHGAVGDGAADDTTAIQDAADAAAPNGTVHFPPGEYLISAPINLKGASVLGAGMHAVTIIAATGNDYNVGIATTGGDDALLWAENEDNWTVRNIGVDAQNEDGACIANYGGSWVQFSNNYARNSDDSGIQHWGGAGENSNDCLHVQITDNLVENCRWNLVFDGSVINAQMSDNVSFEGGARHISVDNRTHTDADMRGIVVSDNVMRHTGGQATTEQAMYIRGGSANDDQRSTDGRVFGRVSGNEVYGWDGPGAELVRCGGRFSENRLHSDLSATDETFTIGVIIDSQYGLRVTDNDFLSIGSTSSDYIIDHTAANAGNNLYVIDNIDNTGAATFYNGGTDAAWVFENNYSETTKVTP